MLTSGNYLATSSKTLSKTLSGTLSGTLSNGWASQCCTVCDTQAVAGKHFKTLFQKNLPVNQHSRLDADAVE